MSAPTSINIDYNHGGTWAVHSPPVVLNAGTHTSTDYIYIPSLGSIQNSIKCDKTSFVWSDNNSSGTPSSVITVGDYVYLGDGHDGSSGVASSNFSTFRGRFEIPVDLRSGGTSTEGVAVESGSLTLVNGDVVYVVDSTSISHTYYLKIDGVFAGGLHSNWQHTAGTQSGGTFVNAQDGKFTLEYEESSAPFNHVKIAELTVGRKKVFCNFW